MLPFPLQNQSAADETIHIRHIPAQNKTPRMNAIRQEENAFTIIFRRIKTHFILGKNPHTNLSTVSVYSQMSGFDDALFSVPCLCFFSSVELEL
jgi:hypothetical protein